MVLDEIFSNMFPHETSKNFGSNDLIDKVNMPSLGQLTVTSQCACLNLRNVINPKQVSNIILSNTYTVFNVRRKRILIVVPFSLFNQWKTELKICFGTTLFSEHVVCAKSCLEFENKYISKHLIFLISFSLLKKLESKKKDKCARFVFDMIFYDEVHGQIENVKKHLESPLFDCNFSWLLTAENDIFCHFKSYHYDESGKMFPTSFKETLKKKLFFNIFKYPNNLTFKNQVSEHVFNLLNNDIKCNDNTIKELFLTTFFSWDYLFSFKSKLYKAAMPAIDSILDVLNFENNQSIIIKSNEMSTFLPEPAIKYVMFYNKNKFLQELIATDWSINVSLELFKNITQFLNISIVNSFHYRIQKLKNQSHKEQNLIMTENNMLIKQTNAGLKRKIQCVQQIEKEKTQDSENLDKHFESNFTILQDQKNNLLAKISQMCCICFDYDALILPCCQQLSCLRCLKKISAFSGSNSVCNCPFCRCCLNIENEIFNSIDQSYSSKSLFFELFNLVTNQISDNNLVKILIVFKIDVDICDKFLLIKNSIKINNSTDLNHFEHDTAINCAFMNLKLCNFGINMAFVDDIIILNEIGDKNEFEQILGRVQRYPRYVPLNVFIFKCDSNEMNFEN